MAVTLNSEFSHWSWAKVSPHLRGWDTFQLFSHYFLNYWQRRKKKSGWILQSWFRIQLFKVFSSKEDRWLPRTKLYKHLKARKFHLRKLFKIHDLMKSLKPHVNESSPEENSHWVFPLFAITSFIILTFILHECSHLSPFIQRLMISQGFWVSATKCFPPCWEDDSSTWTPVLSDYT